MRPSTADQTLMQQKFPTAASNLLNVFSALWFKTAGKCFPPVVFLFLGHVELEHMQDVFAGHWSRRKIKSPIKPAIYLFIYFVKIGHSRS